MDKRAHRKFLTAVGITAIAIASAATSAQEAQQGAKTPEQKQEQAASKGTRSAADIRIVTIVVKETNRAENKVTFEAKVSPEANIVKNGKRIAINDLHAGDALQVSFDTRTGDVVGAV